MDELANTPPSNPAQLAVTKPTNKILYGPPGTGKTYSVMREALTLIEGAPPQGERADMEQRFEALRRAGRVAMLTFHQAYEYEEFIEGIRPVLDDSDTGEVGYELRSGVFKRLCATAARLAKRRMRPPRRTHLEVDFEQVWQALVEELQSGVAIDGRQPGLSEPKGSSTTPVDGIVEIGKSGKTLNWHRPERRYQSAPVDYVRAIWRRDEERALYKTYSYPQIKTYIAEELGTGGGCHGYPIWLVYRRLRELEGFMKRQPRTLEEPSEIELIGEDDGLVEVFGQAMLLDVEQRRAIPFTTAPACVLIIDEINRGNIAKIFGELISLIEPSKRLGMEEGMLVTLPYSQELFGVPANLHIIGTMNTADRSIALLDIALRRRFIFEELMPDAGLVERALASSELGQPGAKLVADALRCINARIEFLLDRDHQIGHAYFLGAQSWEDVRRVMVERVIPLLQEYFYGAWDRIGAALGCPFKDGSAQLKNVQPWLVARTLDERKVLGYDHDDYESSRTLYAVAPALARPTTDAASVARAMRGVISEELLALLSAQP
jgi:5-methylcytosine-specific restriction enzyme B